MPLPTPRPGESRDAFVSRFMSSTEARGEFPEREQRAAEALSTFRKGARRMAKALYHAVKGVLSARKAEDAMRDMDAEHADMEMSPAERRRRRRRRRQMAKSAAAPLTPGVAYRITKARVQSLALCRRGKNGLRTLLKSEDGGVEFQALVKTDAVAETGELLAVAYAPGRPDADGWVADQEVVRSMSRDFMRNGAAIDIEHDGEALSPEDAYVSQSFIIQKADPRFADWRNYDGSPVGDLTGAWGVSIQIDNPELRAACKAGAIDGVSVFGLAAVEPLQKSSAADETMNPEQMAALAKSVATAVVEALKPKTEEPAKPALPAAEQPPKFEGDPLTVADLERFEKAQRAYEFRKAVSEGKMTADQVAELRKAASESLPSDEETGVKPEDSPEVRSLKLALFKAMRKSNAPAQGGPRETEEEILRKAEIDEGKAIAALHNESLGFRLVAKP